MIRFCLSGLCYKTTAAEHLQADVYRQQLFTSIAGGLTESSSAFMQQVSAHLLNVKQNDGRIIQNVLIMNRAE